MGISGLLTLLRETAEETHLSKFSGKTLAIDASAWLYKGAYGCAMDIALGKDTDFYVAYCIRRLMVFREHKVTPIFVFDGAPLPMKACPLCLQQL